MLWPTTRRSQRRPKFSRDSKSRHGLAVRLPEKISTKFSHDSDAGEVQCDPFVLASQALPRGCWWVAQLSHTMCSSLGPRVGLRHLFQELQESWCLCLGMHASTTLPVATSSAATQRGGAVTDVVTILP
jgi:hypothetical protein